MSALERLCHLLLELRERLERIGLADERRMALPLTQEMMADALGLSIVHVNRTLQQLRQERMIELRAGVAHLVDVERMVELCGYREAAAPTLAALPPRVLHASVGPIA
jgi:DNA-binding GntR family transcriptional regulator